MLNTNTTLCCCYYCLSIWKAKQFWMYHSFSFFFFFIKMRTNFRHQRTICCIRLSSNLADTVFFCSFSLSLSHSVFLFLFPFQYFLFFQYAVPSTYIHCNILLILCGSCVYSCFSVVYTYYYFFFLLCLSFISIAINEWRQIWYVNYV